MQIPILLFSGDHDLAREMGKGVIRVYHMFEKAGIRNLMIRLFKRGRHEMLNETNKYEVYSMILEWLEKEMKTQEKG